MKKRILVAVIFVLILSVICFRYFSYPREVSVDSMKNAIDLIGELPTKAFKIENSEYALVSDIGKLNDKQCYAITLLDKKHEFIESFSLYAENEQLALKERSNSEVHVNKLFGGQKGFKELDINSNLFARLKRAKKSSRALTSVPIGLFTFCNKAYISEKTPDAEAGMAFRVHLYCGPVPLYTLTYIELDEVDGIKYYFVKVLPGAV